MEYTFSLIKPDAAERNLTCEINAYFERAGLKVVAQKMTRLTKKQAEEFYAEHKERPFFNSMIATITSGIVVLQVLKGENAIAVNRKVMGATNPADAEEGTIRRKFSFDIERNSVHGSDSPASAEREINLFFTKTEILD